MSRVEFDELLRQRIDSEPLDIDPTPGWERMAALLPPAANVVPLVKKRRIVPYIAAAAASVAVIAVAAYMFSSDAGDNNINRDHTLSEKPKTDLPLSPNGKAVDSVEGAEGQKSNGPVNSIFTTPGMNQAPSGEPSIAQEPIPVQENAFGKNPEEAVVERNIVPPVNETRQHIAQEGPLFNNQKEEANKDNYTFKTPELMASNNRKYTDDLTSIGLGGGVNYGTMNTGYTLGLSARRYVSDKVFVDGTVAVMMNKNSESTLNYTGNFIADNAMAKENTRARPSSENYYYPAQGLYYIQFNPSVGYKLGKKVAMSVGGDFQQMLQNSGNNETVMFSEGTDAKLFPTFDVGVTGKTEVNITPAIQAGLMYREGLNNVIRNQSHYVNRRYIQVQVKYSLSIK